MKQVLSLVLIFLFLGKHLAFSYNIPALHSLGDTTIVLKDVLVEAPRPKIQTIGLQNILLDSARLNRFENNFFGDILNQQNLLFIKTYGVGGLAIPAFRGTSAEHTAVLWNGINLQSPMNGTLDFSLLPPEFIGEALVQPGSNAAKWGSGSVGGTIHLSNPIKFGAGIKAGFRANFGSFESLRQSASFSSSQKKSYFSVKLLNFDALNNFPYKNVAEKGQPIENQTNAGVRQQGILVEQSFLLPKNQLLNIKYWYLNSDRQIAPVMGAAKSEAKQQDWFHRITGDWQKQGKTTDWYIRSAYFDERILYKDIQNGFYSFSRSISSVSEIENKFRFSKHQSLSFRINNTFSKAVSDGYPNFPEIYRVGGFVTYQLAVFSDNLEVSATLREEWVNGKWIPLIPFLGLSYQLSPDFKIRASASRAYRLPTFNDLYWVPGGNQRLLPEIGWNQEAGIEHKKAIIQSNNLSWNIFSSATFFSSQLQNRIIWQPSNFGYYTPLNIQQVWARGVELNFKSDLQIYKVNCELLANYDFTHATAEKVEAGQESQLGKQLIYIPLHKASGSATVSWRQFTFAYNHAFKGYRYTVADNKDFLLGYALGDLQLSKVIPYKQYSLKVFAQINNIWAEDYQVLPNRPMPQRNYLCGIAFQFYQPLKPLIK